MLSVSVFTAALTAFLYFSFLLFLSAFLLSWWGFFCHICTPLTPHLCSSFFLISLTFSFIYSLSPPLFDILYFLDFPFLVSLSLPFPQSSGAELLLSWLGPLLSPFYSLSLSCFLSVLSPRLVQLPPLLSGASPSCLLSFMFVCLNLCVRMCVYVWLCPVPDRQAVWTAHSWGSSTVPAAPVRLPRPGARRPYAPHHTHGRSPPPLQPVGTAHKKKKKNDGHQQLVEHSSPVTKPLHNYKG